MKLGEEIGIAVYVGCMVVGAGAYSGIPAMTTLRFIGLGAATVAGCAAIYGVFFWLPVRVLQIIAKRHGGQWRDLPRDPDSPLGP